MLRRIKYKMRLWYFLAGFVILITMYRAYEAVYAYAPTTEIDSCHPRNVPYHGGRDNSCHPRDILSADDGKHRYPQDGEDRDPLEEIDNQDDRKLIGTTKTPILEGYLIEKNKSVLMQQRRKKVHSDMATMVSLFNITEIRQKLKTEMVPFDPLNDPDSLRFYLGIENETQVSISGSPKNFMSTYTNPCWISALLPGDPYKDNLYAESFDFYTRTNRSALTLAARDAFSEVTAMYNERRKVAQKPWRIRCLPYLYLAGVTKSGTTDLFDILTRHPKIVAGAVKEPMWWNAHRIGRRSAWGVAPVPFVQYVDVFDVAAEKIWREKTALNTHEMITLDASPSYLWDYDGWDRIPGNKGYNEPHYLLPHTLKQIVPQARIVVMLRNPTDRVYSYFRMFWADATLEQFHLEVVRAINVTSRCFREKTIRSCAYDRAVNSREFTYPGAVNLRGSLYYLFLRDWLEVFPRDQIHVIKSEEYFRSREYVTNELLGFLELASLPEDVTRDIDEGSVANAKESHPSRSLLPMLDKTRILLDTFFKPFNMALVELLQDDIYLWHH